MTASEEKKPSLYELFAGEPEGFPHMKVFRINEWDWVAAYNPEDAKAYYESETITEDYDGNWDEPKQLSRAQMQRLKFVDDLGDYDEEEDPEDGSISHSFAEQLALEVKHGYYTDGSPFMFATTEC